MNEFFKYSKDWPYHVSAGAVVFSEDFKKIAILYRGKKRFKEESWHLPKGTLHNNEPIESAALREVAEEAGLDINILGYLGAIQQEWISKSTNTLINKTTHYFIAVVVQDNQCIDDEHDAVLWLTPSEAKRKTNLEPKHEDEIIARALKFKRNFL